jgi:hypothetical protein
MSHGRPLGASHVHRRPHPHPPFAEAMAASGANYDAKTIVLLQYLALHGFAG